MSKATIQYRGKEVEVKPGHHAVLDTYKKEVLGQIVIRVEEYEGGGVVPDGVIEITENGDKSVAGYATARVNVTPALQRKTVTPTEQKQEIAPDAEYDGLSAVTVEAIVTQEKTATSNGTVKADEGKYLKQVNVEVPAGAGASGTREISENGEYNVKEYEFAKVNVQPPLQEKVVAPSEQLQEIVPGEGAYGLSEVNVLPIPVDTLPTITENGVHSVEAGKYMKTVTVDVPIPDGYLKPVGDFPITENGEYFVSKYETATVNVQPTLQEKSVTPAASAQEVVSDAGVYGLSKVTVKAVPTEEVNVTEPVKEVVATPGKFISKVNVNVPTVTVYSGTSEPTNDIGEDGDIYLLLEG
jgi:hypothetical protein